MRPLKLLKKIASTNKLSHNFAEHVTTEYPLWKICYRTSVIKYLLAIRKRCFLFSQTLGEREASSQEGTTISVMGYPKFPERPSPPCMYGTTPSSTLVASCNYRSPCPNSLQAVRETSVLWKLQWIQGLKGYFWSVKSIRRVPTVLTAYVSWILTRPLILRGIPQKNSRGQKKRKYLDACLGQRHQFSSFVYSVAVIHGLEADATLKCLIRIHEDKWWQP